MKENIIFVDRIIGPVLGSPCAYSSIIMAKLGLQVGIVSYVEENLEQNFLSQFARVDLQGVLWNNLNTEDNLIYDEAGVKSIEYACTAPLINFEDIIPAYLDAGKFFICPMNYEVDLDMCRCLARMGKTVIVDLGGFGGTTSYHHFSILTPRGKNVIDTLCRDATIIKASKSDLAHIFPGQTIEQAAGYILRAGAKAVLVTMGDEGAAYQVGGAKIRYVPALELNCPYADKNPVGGGDAFSAGVIASYQTLDDLPQAVIFGNAVAALVVSADGGCEEKRMPSSVMVAQKLNGRMSPA